MDLISKVMCARAVSWSVGWMERLCRRQRLPKWSGRWLELLSQKMGCKDLQLSCTTHYAQVDEMIAELSRLFQLQPGDIIMTGTPAGIGPFSIFNFGRSWKTYPLLSYPLLSILIHSSRDWTLNLQLDHLFAGVGSLQPDDKVECLVTGLPPCRWSI